MKKEKTKSKDSVIPASLSTNGSHLHISVRWGKDRYRKVGSEIILQGIVVGLNENEDKTYTNVIHLKRIAR